MREAFSNGAAPEVDLARIVNFDSFRAYKWLISIAEPNQKLYGYLRDNGVDLNQGACDTIRQALGKQPIPKGALPNPGPRHAPDPPQGASSARPELESAMRYGHGARLYYEGHDWNDQLSARLKGEWEDGNQASSWDEVKAVVERGWRSVKRAL